MDPTTLGITALSGLLGGGKSGNTSSNSQATNTLNLNFDPTLVGVAGSGVSPSNGGATSSQTPSITDPQSFTQPSQSNPLSSLYGTTTPYAYTNPLTGYTAAPTQGISGNLSSSSLLLIGGLGLLMVMALSGKKR